MEHIWLISDIDHEMSAILDQENKNRKEKFFYDLSLVTFFIVKIQNVECIGETIRNISINELEFCLLSYFTLNCQ